MKWLIAALAAIGAVAAAVFLWRKNTGGLWSQATDSASSMGKTAADKGARAATAAADEVEGAVAH